MRVDPRYQGRSFGRLILATLEDRALAAGHTTLFMETALLQLAADGLYDNAGYQEIDRGILDGFEVVWLEKHLVL